MKLAIVSDIHGNIEAFNNCLAKINDIDVDEIYFLGDAVGYMPYGDVVLEVLNRYGVHCIKGNHEAMLLGIIPSNEKNEEVYQLNETKQKLSETQLKEVEKWPDKINLNIEGTKILLTHASPFDKYLGYVYPDSNFDEFKNLEEDIIIMGHTHYPFICEVNGKVIVNVGSVGLPRDVGNLSSFGIIDTEKKETSIYRCEFNVLLFNDENNKDKVHTSVLNCFKREREFYIGKLI